MAQTYDPAQTTPLDRVRRLTDDRAAPWRFEDAEILAALDAASVSASGSEEAEIRAAIDLLESVDPGPGLVSESRRQGAWSHTKTRTGGYGAILDRLRARLVRLGVAELGVDASPVGVADAEFPTPDSDPVPPYRGLDRAWGGR